MRVCANVYKIKLTKKYVKKYNYKMQPIEYVINRYKSHYKIILVFILHFFKIFLSLLSL